MRALKTIYKAKLTRYNLGEPAYSHYKEFSYYPTENELLLFLVECNNTDGFKDFETSIIVEKIHLIVKYIKPKKDK